ncbi:MAG TPA: tetratricopeptide repeat protein [candidate division WOR-3 bacterium]|uniref:Tetratricopeptide repeat protein n=1 Tax=candidate division WOR-3 bacterium TaxID=2052148 RepID=A0A9C9EK97_UNCW3|nr:tetratricopeptide repeat protein [candidate division WOR-3 bacterium]
MIVLIILVVALIALVLFLYLYRRREKTTGYMPYIEAMVALLEEDDELAMKKFKEAVRIDSDLIDAYIRLGDLYRKKGDVSTAIQIHQSLTVRPTLKKREEKRIYYALVKDLLETNRHNKAISFLNEILKIDKKDKNARELILKIYEDMESFGDCLALYQESGFKKKSDKRHAFYCASFAHNKLKDISGENPDAEKEAVGLLKKALKIFPESLSALYYLGDYFERKHDLKKAREYYHRLLTKHPDYAFLIIPQFERVYFELDLFDEIIPIYEQIFQQSPKNFPVGLALAEIYEKKNDMETAKSVYARLKEVYPKSIVPKLRLLKLSVDDEKLKENIAEIENTVRHKNYRCKNCGNQVERFSFICKKCHAIESFLPYL